jgi:hypothetical protein
VPSTRPDEIRVCRPAEGATGRGRFVSGKSGQNATKTMIVTDEMARMLSCGATTPGSTAAITHARQAGLVTLLNRHRPPEELTITDPSSRSA